MKRQTKFYPQYSLQSTTFQYVTRSNTLIIVAVCFISAFAGLICFPWGQVLCHFQYTQSRYPNSGRQPSETFEDRRFEAYDGDSANYSRTQSDLDKCPGYHVTNVDDTLPGRLSMDLRLYRSPCNVYGKDIQKLKLDVIYESRSMVRVKFTDPHNERYEVPQEIIDGPVKGPVGTEPPLLNFNFTTSPDAFRFQVLRRSNGEAIFDTGDYPLIFEQQYLRLKTILPLNANIYGLGEHSGTFRFNISENPIRTLWTRDSPGIPYPSNLYGSHPMYIEYREASQMAHGVFLKNSNGMDVKIKEEGHHITLEYNVIGGVLDLFFFAGDDGLAAEGDPKAVAREYSEVIGTPLLPPYWYLGFHQCRWGYRDWIEVAEVVANYSQANIPLETMWTDIDYMSHRQIFTLDPGNFPKERMQKVVNWLHERGQKYVMIVDPAVAYNKTVDGHDYETFIRGREEGIFLRTNDTTIYKGVVWPGVVAYPDWFHKNATSYWTKEFDIFFDKSSGIDIDAVWIDMNEPSNFCPYPCDPEKLAAESGLPPPAPPTREPPRRIPGFPGIDTLEISPGPDIDDEAHRVWKSKYALALTGLRSAMISPQKITLNGRVRNSDVHPDGDCLLNPSYRIHNDFPEGLLSYKTIPTNLRHENGYYEYDVHNLYGTTMGFASYAAMLNRRPNERPVVLGRSTFPGAQRKIFHWLGDNWSTWEQYRGQIAHMLAFSAIYQMPMIGSDVCGFKGHATPRLCARWATLGAFNPFMRNHNWIETPVSQEFYRWPLVAVAARNALDIRYRLLDYFYSALWRQSRDGTPAMMPLWMLLGKSVDHTMLTLEYQFMYGDALMVAPVVEDDGMNVIVYFPTGTNENRVRWFDFMTLTEIIPTGPFEQADSKPLGFTQEYSNVNFTEIPLFWKSGNVIPLRTNSANTTSELRKQNFELLVVPDTHGVASGILYLDDGVSITQKEGGVLTMRYLLKGEGENREVFRVRRVEDAEGGRGYITQNLEVPDHLKVALDKLTILGVGRIPKSVEIRVRTSKDEGKPRWGLIMEKGDWRYIDQKNILVIMMGGGMRVSSEFEVSIKYKET